MTKKAQAFLKNFAGAARAAQDKYKINAYFILSVAAFESSFGTSKIARESNNFFGIISLGNVNAYWNGAKHRASTGLSFRKYASPQNSFLDFGRLIKSSYKQVYQANTIQDFANAMSESNYIDPNNGDDRLAYRKGLIKCYEVLTGTKVQDNSEIILGIGLIGLIFYARQKFTR